MKQIQLYLWYPLVQVHFKNIIMPFFVLIFIMKKGIRSCSSRYKKKLSQKHTEFQSSCMINVPFQNCLNYFGIIAMFQIKILHFIFLKIVIMYIQYPVSFLYLYLALFNFLFLLFLNSIKDVQQFKKKNETDKDIYYSEMILALLFLNSIKDVQQFKNMRQKRIFIIQK